MGIFDKIFGEFIDVIEWLDDSKDTMVYRFQRYGNEIKYGAMLTVRESQMAVLVNEGRVADIYEPGMYQLETNNMPIQTTLENWPHGFNSPFKVEVYFFNMRRFTDLKWGTKNPIMMRDKEFGPVRLRAFGTYSIRIKEPVTFIKEIVGTDGHFQTEEITDQLRNLIVSRFASILGESDIPILDLAANYDQLSDFINNLIKPDFLEYGLDITRLLVENISLPPEVEKALDKRTSIGIVGNLKDYTSFQTADAVKAAAENPSGGASEGIGMGMGFAVAKQLSETTLISGSTNNPPPIPANIQYFVAIDNRQTGPFNVEAIKQKIQSGELTSTTLIWSQPLIEWTAIGKIPEFGSMLPLQPPPIPK